MPEETPQQVVQPEKKQRGGRRPGAGRKPLNIDPKLVETHASYGCNNAEIAVALGCSRDHIDTMPHLREAADRGRLKASMALRAKQYQVAMTGEVRMLIWLGKQICGQKETLDVTSNGEGIGSNEIAERLRGKLARLHAKFGNRKVDSESNGA